MDSNRSKPYQEHTSNLSTGPKVSVIIPTYYRNDLLQHAIDSVVNQLYRPIEVVVVDDSGEEHAKSTVTGYDFDQLTYIPLEKNQGQNAALNIGLDEISGKYVQFLDDDDEIIGDKFSRQVSLMESNDDVGVTYCGVKSDNGETHLPDETGYGNVLERVLQFSLSPCVTSTMLIENKYLSQISPIPTPPGSTDIYMKIELAQVTDFDYIAEPGIMKRDVVGSVGSSQDAIRGNAEVFEEYDELYSRFPNRVRRSALAKYYNRKGSYLLSSQIWSPPAILAFAIAAYYDPGISLPYLGRFIGSIVGRPGVKVVERAMRVLNKYILA